MLAARAINKSYGGVRALVDVDFSIEPGEIVALAGENGSGKSTLAKILAGVVQPDGGELLLDGESCSFARPRDALDHGITLVAQELTAVPQLSVGENVLLSRLPKPLGRFGHELRREADGGRLDREVVSAVLDSVGQRRPRERAAWPAGLTEREVEVLRLVAKGKPDKAIARDLVISPNTVHHHVKQIYQKCEISSRAGAALFAMENDLVSR